MKSSLLKLLVVCVAVVAFASVSFGQKKLSQRCPGSATKAEISISKQGDIAITKCTGRTLTIDGSEYAPVVAPKLYIARLLQTGSAVPPTAFEIVNTTGATVTWEYDDVGSYTATFSASVLTTKTVGWSGVGDGANGAVIGHVFWNSPTLFYFNVVQISSGNPVELGTQDFPGIIVVIEIYP